MLCSKFQLDWYSVYIVANVGHKYAKIVVMDS